MQKYKRKTPKGTKPVVGCNLAALPAEDRKLLASIAERERRIAFITAVTPVLVTAITNALASELEVTL